MAHYHIDVSRRGFAVDAGVEARCPYCLARQTRLPRVGTAITLLSGYDAGHSGTVVSEEGWRPGQFVVEMDYERGKQKVVDASLQLFVKSEALGDLPEWLPPLSVWDTGALHEQVLAGLRYPPQGSRRRAAASVAGGIAITCWSFRLPLSADEVWRVLAAHGMRAELRKDACALYDFGLELLVSANGRPPVKRRRMQPLSRGQYMTARQRALNVRLGRS